jgi:DNA-binding MarR family transcriptional regulator
MWNYSSMTKPGPETLDVWTALLVAHRRLTTQLDADLRAGADMTLDEYDVLYQLRRAGRPLRMSELAARVLISRPTTTRVADHLVQRGWLERRHDDTDRRVVLVGLTPPGKRAQARAGGLHLDGIARLVEAPLAGHELGRVAGALRALAGDRTLAAD